MNLKLYGICFKMRGGPDLLDYVQTNTPVPVDVMGQVMDQMGSVTQDELAFAGKLDNDWKMAFNERVPMLMGVVPGGGYDITCTVPDELLGTVRVLTGMENEKIMEEYAASYLKDVCGIDADIISVDVEKADSAQVRAEAAAGFDLEDLAAVPDEPIFDDVSEFAGMGIGIDAPAEPVHAMDAASAEPVHAMDAASAADYAKEDVPIEEGYPDAEDFPDAEDLPEEEEAYYDGEDAYDGDGDEPEHGDPGQPDDGAPDMETTQADAVAKIYTELVTNIRDRKLDERLGIQIGQ